MTDLITGLSCPICSGTLAVREGQRIVKCPYCNNCSYAKGERGVARYQVARAIDRDAAAKAVRGFWSGFNKAMDLSQKAKITELFLAYIPYWRAQAKVAGWIFGRKEVGSGKNRHKEPREVQIMEPMEWTGAAGDVGEFGVDSVSTVGKNFAAYDSDALHREGMVFEPSGSVSDAQTRARHTWFERGKAKASLNEISQAWLRNLREAFSIVYYPLWVARYAYRNRNYQVVVDGNSGRVLFGKAPGNIFFRALMLMGGTALGSFVLVDGLALAVTLIANMDDPDEGVIALLAIPFVVGGGLIAGGFRLFRYGEEIEHKEKGK